MHNPKLKILGCGIIEKIGREERNKAKEETGLSGPPQLCTSMEPTRLE
jgi:hypothetical protein